jgi:hypothetical protein
MFYRLGNPTLIIYEDNNPKTFNTDLQIYEKQRQLEPNLRKNELLKSYNNLEPRFLLLIVNQRKPICKKSYNRMAQYLQLISNTSSHPLDIWTPSDNL